MSKTKMLILAGLFLSLANNPITNKEEISVIANQYFQIEVKIKVEVTNQSSLI
jgi:hypothetical protein